MAEVNMNENRKWLYDVLTNKGVQMGAYEEFDKNVDANKDWLYNTAKSKGVDIGDYDAFDKAMSNSQIPAVTVPHPGQQQLQQPQPRPKSPYVEGKGEETMIFGVPYADYQQMTPEEQSKQYSAAIEKRKNDEKDFFSNYISGQLGEIDSELNKEREPVPMPAGSAFIPSSAVGSAQRFGNGDTKETQDRYTSLHAAKNLLDDANKLVEEAKKGDTGFFSSLGRGFKDKFMDTDNWTMGLTDTAYSGLLRKAIEKDESGEELSPEESKLLDAAAVNMATQAYFSSDMSRGYKAGSTTAQSIPFMLEFAVNPVSSSGNALAKGLLKHGLKRFGRVATSNAAKVAGRLVGDAAAAAGMTATSSIGRVASGTNERMIGDVQATVEDGEIKYAGRENGMEVGEALGKSAVSNFLENQSEMVFNAFAGGGKLAKEALSKFIPDFSKLSNSEIVQFISKIKNNPTIKNVAERTQFHGLLGEYAEEVYNNFANIPLGEMTVEQATDLDNNIDTFLGLAPTSAAFGLLGLGGMAREKYTTQRNLHRFKEGLNEEDQALFDELQQVINAGDKETTKAFIKRTLADEKLTQEEKKERVFAVQGMQEEKVLEDVQNEDVSAGVTPEDIEANKIDIYRNFKRAERKVNSLLPEEVVSQLDAVSDLGQFASANNLNEQQVSALADYLPAKEIFSQYVDHTNSRKEEAKMQAREQAITDVERISNPETGFVTQVKHKFADNPVYLVGGNLALGEDGFLDRDNSSETVYYVDETGERKMAQAEDFDSVLSEVPIDDMIVQAEANAEQDFIANEEESLRSPDIPAPVRGETVMMDGSRYLIEGDNMDDPGLSVMAIKLNDAGEIDIENGDERPISIDDYYSLKESEMWQDDIVPAPLQEETLQTEETPLESEVIQEETDQVSVPVEGESVKEETPEQRLQKVLDTLPKKKDGSIDYKSMTPQQQFDYTSAVDSPEVAIEDLKGDVAAKNEELEKINARLAKATGGERVELRDLIRSKKKELDELNTFFQSVVPEQSDTSESMETSQVPEEVRTDEDYISWVADNSDDANEVLGAYSAAKDLASHEQTLKPWQRELLGRKVSTSSFNRFGDRNQITGALAKGWLRKDGQEIDTIAQELSENGVEVTEQDIVDFMLTNPSNHVSQVSDTMRSLSSKFSEIATKEMGIPVGGPESNTGRLYIKLKEADQKIDKLTDKQKNEIEEALSADMDASDTQRTDSYYEALDDYIQQYDQFRNEFDEEAADEAIIQSMEENNPELYHGGFTADELDDIYSQIENNNGTERQAEDSRENQSPLSGEEVKQHGEPGTSEVAATENSEGEEQNNGVIPNEQLENIDTRKLLNTEQPTVSDLSVVEPSSSIQENGNNTLNSEDNSVSLQGDNQKVNENDEVSESIPQGEHGTLLEISGEQEEPVYQLRRRIEEASRNASESERGRGHQQEVNQMIEAQAKESGLWTPIQNLSNLGTPFLSGNENDTYLDRENDAVYKMNNLVNSKNLPELFKRIDLHNELFPQTKYELVGFTGFGNGGAIYPIYKQEYIDNAEFATPEEIGNYMQALGFNKTGEAEYSNGDVTISDLRPRNVLKDAEGDVYVIDADFKRNIPTPKENNPAQFVSPQLEPGEDILDYTNRISESKRLFDAEQEVDTNPTEAQKSAGNYKKGHIKIDGYDITIENPKGSERSGVDTNGQPWSVTMNNTYGYIRGTEGVDGDHIDVFLSDNPAGGKVYVIDQMNEDGSFDEHKVMYGFNSALAAKRAYMKNYSPGWKGLGKTTEVSKKVFNEWVKSSKRKTKPFAEYKIAKENADNIAEIQSEDVLQADTVEYGVSNKLVSKDRYEELKNKLRGKLGQMNIGFDPELFSIGAEMAAYHIEAGARKFGDFAQRMIEDVGDAVRPYLKSFYEGARQFPGMEDFQKDMDEYHAVKDFDTDSFDKAVEFIDKATLPAKESKSNNRKSSENTVSSQKSESNKPAEMQDLFNQNLEDHGERRNSEERNPDTDRSMGGKTREEAVRTERRRNDTGVHGHNVPDADRSGRVPESTGRVVSSVKVQRNRNNYNFGENHIDVPAGDVAKLKANIDAIRTLREVENSGKPATEQQKAKLARYVGWGGLANALDENKFKASERSWIADANWNAKYLPYYKQLKELLSPEEFRSAVQSTTTSHYTPEPIIRNLWNIATRVGFTGGMISEPAMGVGHILGLMPKGIAENSQISGFEIDSLSGRISKALYPDANTKVQGYETEFAPQSKDIVITNVPFGKDAPYDKFLDKSLRKKLGGAYNLHNYFIAKGLLELKENGLGVFITSSATMDGADSRFREFVAGNGFDMVGAIRLPNDAFQKNAGTSVTADILVFRKRKAGEVANGVNYISTTPVGEGTYEEKGEKRTKPIMINEYFAARPEMMLGEMMTAFDAGSGGLYSGASQTLKARSGLDLSQALSEAIGKLPENILGKVENSAVVKDKEQTTQKDGTLTVKDGKVYVAMSGVLEPVPVKETFTYNGKLQKTVDAVQSYNDLKSTLKKLIAAEQSLDIDPEPIRKELNKQYDAFAKKYGTLNRNKALDNVFVEDFERYLPLSLENVTKVPSATGKSSVYQITKGKGILDKRVSYPVKEPSKADNLQDAVNISRSYRGAIDIPYISQLIAKSEEEVIDDMLHDGVAYRDPLTGDLVDRGTYLSGNVKEKLEEARTAAERDPAFEKNVEELINVQPEMIRFGDISYRLGTPWIPAEFIDKFAEDVLGLSDTGLNFVSVLNEYVTGKSISVADYAKAGIYKTDRLGTIDLFEAALNQRKPKVYDEIKNGEQKIRVVNEAETQAAAEKVMEISDKFIEYIDGQKPLHKELERIYNDKYNNFRLKEYDLPAFEHYPNSNTGITLRAHQMKAVQRSFGESTLYAHQVGTGKTFTMITTAMEMRRLGIARKPMIVVQNATLEDFVKDFYKLYPGANVLAPGKDERSADNRKRLFNLIATGDFDAIIIPQSFMQFIPDDEGRKKELIQQKIDEYERVIEATENESLRRRLEKEVAGLKDQFEGVEKPKKRSVKDKAKAENRIKTKMERQFDRRTDDVLTFEQMGIDALFIDEAHNYKKIGFASKMSNVKGIDTTASQRANSLLLKAKWVQEKNNGRNVILATGTPITNTMAEVWTMMNFVAPDILEAYSIQTFDEFATTFGTVEPSLEFTATGNFKIADRFKSYVNVPELVKAFRSHADVVLTEDVEEFKESSSIPKLRGGAMTNIVIDKNEDLEDVMQVLISELESFSKMSGKEKRRMSALPLVVFTKAKQAAIDLRLLNPSFADNPNSKTNQVVSNVVKLYNESNADKGAQLIFCDSYQSPGEQPKMDLFDYDPNTPRFNLYEDIKQKLIVQGIPANEIAIINNYDGERRKGLFEKVRSGDVRILLGSTEKMGVGVNVQDRLYGLHHIDAPVRPMDFEQRNGRILRQGNNYALWGKPVNVVTYGVQGTLDATAYDRLRIKQNFINQMMKGNVSGRIMEEQDDEDPSGMTFNQMAATLSGDKTAQLLFVAENLLKKLRNLKRSDANSKSGMAESIEYTRNRIIHDKGQKKVYERAYKTISEYFPDGVENVTVDGETYTEKFGPALEPVIASYEDAYSLNRGTAPLKIMLNNSKAEVIVHFNEGRMVYELYAGNEHIVEGRQFNGGKGLMSSIEHQLKAVEKNLSDIDEKIASYEKRVQGLTEAMNTPWGREDELKAAEKEVEGLKKQLEEKAKSDNDSNKRYRIVYHGGGVQFEKFDINKVGTGQGTQAFGWGLYFTSSKDIAKWYAEDSAFLNAEKSMKEVETYDYALDADIDYDKARTMVIEEHERFLRDAARIFGKDSKEWKDAKEDLELATNTRTKTEITKSNKNLYEVSLPDNIKLLDWDRVLEPNVVDRFLNIVTDKYGKDIAEEERTDMMDTNSIFGGVLYDSAISVAQKIANSNLIPQNDIYKEASMLIKDTGFDGIIYDAGRNFGNAKRGDKNYVIFDEESISLIDKMRYRISNRVSNLIRKGKENKIVSAINALSNALHSPVNIVRRFDDLPSDVRSNEKMVKGWSDLETGEISVYLPNATNVEDVQATVLHEVIGHRGLNEVFGEQYDGFIDKVFENTVPATRRKIIELGIKREYDFHLATEEYLAELAEKGFEREKGFLRTIKSLFTDMFHRAKIKLGFRLNDGDLRYMLWRTYQLKTEGRSADSFAKDMSMRYKLKVGNYRETPVRKKYRSDNATAEKDVAKHLYEARTLDRMYKYQEAYQDSMLGLKTLQEALEKETDKPIADYENAYMAENQLSSKNSFEQEFYKMNFFDPIMSEVNKLIKTGVEYGDILDYLKAKHGLERNEEFAKRAAEEAKEPFLEKLNDLEKLLADGGIDGLTFDEERDNLNSEMEEAAEDAYIEARGKDFSGLSSLTGEKENFTTEAEKLVSAFEEGNDTAVLWEKINAATKESLKKSYECGLMTKDAYQKVNAMFKYYIPLRGWKEDTAADVYDYIMEERPIFNVPVKKMGGRMSEADDPLATIANMAESAIMQGNRNLMKQRFLAMVINHPTSLATVKQMWYTYDGVRDEWQQALPEIPEDATGEEVAALVEEFERRMVELAKEGLARKGRLEVPYRALPREQKQHMVVVKKDGLEYTVYINGNPRAAQAVNGLTNPDASKSVFLNTVKRINRQMAANFTTRNPAFVISNLARDVIFSASAIAIKEDHKYANRFRRNLIKNGLGLRLGELLYKSEKNSLDLNNELERYFSEFLKNGGETGYTALHSVEEHRKMIERSIMDAKGLVDLGRIFGLKPGKVTTPTTLGIVPAFQFVAKWTEFGNRCAEDVSRFTTYMTSRQMGRSISRSISDAKEVTVNFNKKGAGSLCATTLKSLFLFFNAAVQSLANFANLAKANPKRFSAAVGGFTAAGIILPIINNLLIGMFGGDDDKDAYENLPEWVRKNNFCFWLGGDKFLTIPIPIELRAFYGSGELFRSYMEGKGDNRNIGMELMGQFTELLPINPFGGGEWNIPKGTPVENIVGTVVGNLMPDAGKPIYQVFQNKDFFGKPIYKDSFNELMPEWTKAYAGTSKALVSSTKLLNEVTGGDKYDRGLLNMNPAILEHFFESYFGGLGKTINQVGKTVSMIWDEDERMWRSVPVLNRFLSGGDERNVFSRVNEAYFNYLGEYKVVENRLRGYKKEIKTGNEQYRAKLKELENSSEYERYSVLKKYQKRVKSYQDLIKEETDRETRKAYETALNLLKTEIVEELRSVK